MQAGAVLPYERALATAGPLGLRTVDGRTLHLDLARWLAPADAADETVLARCDGPTLDVGCGPGRFVAALGARGVPALGVDIAVTAIALNLAQGNAALLRSVYGRVPGEGRWPVVLVMDGNIGIGGDPLRLLARLRGVAAADGRVLVEVDPDPDRHEVLSVRFEQNGVVVGTSFPWACVGARALDRMALEAGYSTRERWSAAGRKFVALG